MERLKVQYGPSLDAEVIEARLRQLLVPDQIEDQELESRLARLDERFRVYAACFPFGMWGPGLAVTHEMKVVTESYLPLNEIRAAFRRLFTLSLRCHSLPPPPSVIDSSETWLEILHHLQPLVREANPSRLLRRLMADGDFRMLFLFRLFVPPRFGGSFGRYPGQAEFLRNWLTETGPLERVRCLDAACGSGEGTYDLSLLLLATGYRPEKLEIHGATIAPLEVFTAAHGWFPHEPVRQTAFRSHIGSIFKEGTADSIVFTREDLSDGECCGAETYHVVLCNGLLGGPLLNERQKVAGVVAGLCARLKPGGILLAADRFHAGWQRKMSSNVVGETMAANGLEVLNVGEGVAGVQR